MHLVLLWVCTASFHLKTSFLSDAAWKFKYFICLPLFCSTDSVGMNTYTHGQCEDTLATMQTGNARSLIYFYVVSLQYRSMDEMKLRHVLHTLMLIHGYMWPSTTKWGSLRGVSKREVFHCNEHYFLHILMQKMVTLRQSYQKLRNVKHWHVGYHPKLLYIYTACQRS